MLGEQCRQRAEGLGGCRLASAPMKARADQGNGAERGAEQKAAASFALEVPTALLTAPMPRQETRRLGRNQPRLRAGQHGFRLIKRQADLLKLVITLAKAGNHLVAEHVIIVSDDPKLDLNSHGLSEGSIADDVQPTCLPQHRPLPGTSRNFMLSYTSRHVRPTAARRGGLPCKALPRPERLGLVIK
jgi:hypothetical protein